MKIDAFIINVESCVKRREILLKELEKFPKLVPHVVVAVEGKNLLEEEINNVYLSPNNFFQRLIRLKLTNNEIACVLSHLKCVKEISNKGLEYALILEDDAVFSNTFQDSVLESIKFIKKSKKPAVVLFSARTTIAKKAKFKMNGFSFHKCINGVGSYGYLINYKAAQIIAKKYIPFSDVSDDWFKYVCLGIKVFSVQPHQLSFFGEEDDSLLRKDRNENWNNWQKWVKKYYFLYRVFQKIRFRSIFTMTWMLINRGVVTKKMW